MRCDAYVKFALFLFVQQITASDPVWRWECEKNSCIKKPITNQSQPILSLSVCQLFCYEKAAIWPLPTGPVTIGNFMLALNPYNIEVAGNRWDAPSHSLTSAAVRLLRERITVRTRSTAKTASGRTLLLTLNIRDDSIARLALTTDESYQLTVAEAADGRVNASINAPNFFGLRHGLDTLNQLIVYNDVVNELQIIRDVNVEDAPAYPHRGILLDTARNYIDVATIKRTIDGMALVKLNVFHWHITDSQSFPYVSKSLPNLSKYGAYTPSKVYTPEDVESIIVYGLERGVRVLPEFDAPAHVGEGWQDTDLVVCFNAQPWQNYCVEPPCGQLDPTRPELYDYLEKIYADMVEQFKPDVFHMGGDEVNFACWNSSSRITDWMVEKGWNRTEADFIKLWDVFQTQALERLYKITGKEIPVILWTSSLTQLPYLTEYLPKDKYIIQIWTTGDDPQVKNLLDNGYKILISNYDALYLDCGFSGWVDSGNSWCSPYKGWRKIYDNKPVDIAGEKKNQVLGGEATLWTEQTDSTAVDSKLWPRSAAWGEVLWSEPKNGWREAENRLLVAREKLVQLGVKADALEPEWCSQYAGNCPLGGAFNN